MELPSIQGLGSDVALLPLEKEQKVSTAQRRLRIGVPSEAPNQERRVALAPYAAGILVASGHEIRIESGAGEAAHFSDREYSDAGAEVVDGAGQIYGESDMVVKVFPPRPDEIAMMKERQVLVSAMHLGAISPDMLKRLMELRVTAIGFEFIAERDGTLPIVRMMHEISGSMAVQTAARLLESTAGGRGLMLGGISGVPPATVVILGAGVVGEWAARTALGFGAHVIVLDTDLSALRSIEHSLDRRVTTAMANPQYVRQAVRRADVVIGAMMGLGTRSPVLVTEETVAKMRDGAVIVDVVIDQGGCVETSRPTTADEPTFVQHGVIHHCVPNLPSAVARTATYALSNVLTPYMMEIGDAPSINDALWNSPSLQMGTYVYRGHLCKKSLATMFGMSHRGIELLIASGI
ncbi:alanine dehydrogenase [Rubricoccus marinus]|uniref:alanine dehydrogenase n=1 Tax=Rubricoccus marinus TaxID=716817 RepID=A0A259TXK4_9BACT|nr:alanine dehydrogenase [Rubricoccus marinus]OZC02304.1 alanine dehydrogenase [Rubricoccus marinus]